MVFWAPKSTAEHLADLSEREVHRDRVLNSLNHKLEHIMATLDQVLADVTAESSQINAVGALITGLKQQIADALSGATLPPAVQAKVDSIFATAEANKAAIQSAIDANASAAPPAVPAS